jgi:hypothetical protein
MSLSKKWRTTLKRRGVYYDPIKNLWRASYSNRLQDVREEAYFAAQKDAEAWRKRMEHKYGMPRIGRPLKGKDTNRSNS